MQEKDRQTLKMLVRSRMKFQDVRKANDNRLGVKSAKVNGEQEKQNLAGRREFDSADLPMIEDISKAMREQEKIVEKNLEMVLKRFLVYEQWLKQQKGVGTIASAWIISEFDIEKATTVSKLWQFAGLNPGMVRGQKSVKKKSYKPEMGEIMEELTDMRDGEKRYRVKTDILVKGDSVTPGFLSPYNKRLKTALVGVLADGFIKAQAPYALDYYYPYKERLTNSEQMTKEIKKGGKVVELFWKDCTKGHRDMAAKRKMIKAFLKDLYVAWRGLEGLPVREPYAEEYLGKKHGVKVVGKKKEVVKKLKKVVDKKKVKST